jgi:hypothetical protein
MATNTPLDWITLFKTETEDEESPLGMLYKKQLSHFNTLNRNFSASSSLLLASLGQFPQNFAVLVGPTKKQSQDSPQSFRGESRHQLDRDQARRDLRK